MKQRINGHRFARDWMGKAVKVTAIIRRSYPRTEAHERVDLAVPILGWVTGYTYRRPGRLTWTEDEGSHFEMRGTPTPVVIVSPWPGRATIDAAFDGIELSEDVPKGPPEWTDAKRAEWSRWTAEDMKRDDHGRFLLAWRPSDK